VTDKASVDLHGAAQTMLTTLYLKALDADFDRPILGDRYAKDAVARLDYDWRDLGIGRKWAPLVTVRAAQFDLWATQFLAAHSDSTVVHLGCGLDSRVYRLDPGPDVEWYDVDYPAVIALREQVYPTSATEDSWLSRLPKDRPVLLLAEGVSMYLAEHDGVSLLRRIVDHFPSGELQMDFYNWFGIKTQGTQKIVRRSGATLRWAVNSPQDVLTRVPGLRLLIAASLFDASTFGGAPRAYHLAGELLRAVPPVRNALQYHRYAFGPVDHGD
jgi:O-methyltransferase involved in polyketide biosynthesis